VLFQGMRGSLAFVGYRSHATIPDLVVLPRNARWSGRSGRDLGRILTDRGVLIEFGTRVPLDVVDERTVDALIVAVRLSGDIGEAR
jgi:hypothetical protein